MTRQEFIDSLNYLRFNKVVSFYEVVKDLYYQYYSGKDGEIDAIVEEVVKNHLAPETEEVIESSKELTLAEKLAAARSK